MTVGWREPRTTGTVTIMRDETFERKFMEETLEDLRDGISKLEEEREVLDWRIDQKRERLQAWEAKLGILGPPVPPPSHKRSPKGANLKMIIGLLQDPASPRQGLSTAEIVAKTNLKFSSVQAALRQGQEADLVEQVGSFWRPKSDVESADPATSDAAARNGAMT